MKKEYHKRAVSVFEKLNEEYNEFAGLKYNNTFQLLIAVILSAQTTDKSVNAITPRLFLKYKNPFDFASADVKDIEQEINSIGLYKSKASSIKVASEKIVKDFNGNVPDNMEHLLSLKGVGRKTANVVLQEGFGIVEGFVVDTHVFRLAKRIFNFKDNSPEKIEKKLMATVPEKYWKELSHLLITHGRKICRAKNPLCEKCILSAVCIYYKNRHRPKLDRIICF